MSISCVLRWRGHAPSAHPSEIRGTQAGDRGKDGGGSGQATTDGVAAATVLLKRWERESGRGSARTPPRNAAQF
ncbi:MAG: hypothetical protein OXQ89_23855, partial [Rhodospirillaceae bacterium]|nr:hypothetical protein [Rhodospirillaceae bacterium]